MQKNGQGTYGENSERPRQVQEAARRSEETQSSTSLSKRVAEDARQIMAKLERYRNELKADEAHLLRALEQVRADLHEAGEVIQAMQPALDVVNGLFTRVDSAHHISDTVAAVRVLKNKANGAIRNV